MPPPQVGLDWEQLYTTYCSTPSSEARKKLISLVGMQLPNPERLEFQWLLNALSDSRRKWFVADIFRARRPIPLNLFRALIRAAVYEPDPSLNKEFLRPCLANFSRDEVATEMLPYLAKGSVREQAGAAQAFYWVYGLGPPPTKYAKEVWGVYLRIFVETKDLDVRRGLIAYLRPFKEWYPEEQHFLLLSLIRIAHSTTDEYIRNRWISNIQIEGGLVPRTVIPIKIKPSLSRRDDESPPKPDETP